MYIKRFLIYEFVIYPLVLSASSSKSKESSEISSVNLPSLRSHILASHNNVCSDSHIQSHINAELARRSRREKVMLLSNFESVCNSSVETCFIRNILHIEILKKRELPTKNIEYGVSSREDSSKSRDVPRSLSNSKTRYHSSTDRSSNKFSPK